MTFRYRGYTIKRRMVKYIRMEFTIDGYPDKVFSYTSEARKFIDELEAE